MPDFSLDHTLLVDDLEQFVTDIRRVWTQGGGEVASVRQNVQRGGCATLIASGLARLGVSAHLFGRTSPLGLEVLGAFIRGIPVDIQHVQVDGRLGLMTVLEVGADKINVMIGDPDSMSPFRFQDLSEADRKLLKSCSLVGVFDWVYNRTGTELARELCSFAKSAGVLTYLDTADPGPRQAELRQLFEEVVCSGCLDILSVNENELNHYAGFTSGSPKDGILTKAEAVKRRISARLEVHCSRFAVSLGNTDVAVIPAFRVRPLRTTGAGDSWNSGNIFGHILGLPAAERLLVANAVAAYYISHPEADHPSIDKLADFVAQTPLREVESG